MKNYTMILCALMMLFAFEAIAQPGMGVKAGLNYGGLSGYESGKKPALHAGLFLQWKSTDKLVFQPELTWQRLVQGYMTDVNEETVENSLVINMAALPVMIRYYPARTFYIEAGPQIAVITGAKDQGPAGAKADVHRNLSNTVFSFNAGAGMEFGKKLSFYLRYTAGINDLTRFDDNPDRARYAQAGIAYRLK